jgi:hypothetical protein
VVARRYWGFPRRKGTANAPNVPLTSSSGRARTRSRCSGASCHRRCCRPSCSCAPSWPACPEADRRRCCPWRAGGELAAGCGVSGGAARFDGRNPINQRPDARDGSAARARDRIATWLAMDGTGDSNGDLLGSRSKTSRCDRTPTLCLCYRLASDWLAPSPYLGVCTPAPTGQAAPSMAAAPS